MASIWYVHWDAEEAEERAQGLRDSGHLVTVHSTPGKTPRLPSPAPDLVVVSLDRLPSHGAAIVAWLRSSVARRKVPVLLEGGMPERTVSIRESSPGVTWCPTGGIADVLARGGVG